MSVKEAAIDVNLPVRAVYNQWTQFESFPQFMEGVESVTQLDDTHLHWVARIGGARREWDAEIVEQRPDECIAWRSTSGTRNAGMVTFTPVDANCTRVRLDLDFEPEGVAEVAGDKLGLVMARISGDLARFRDFIEGRGHATGGWRGEVHEGRPRSR